MIDKYYQPITKDHYYLGVVSQVNNEFSKVQIENLAILDYRNIRLESFILNSINYYVVVETEQGIFFAEVTSAKVGNNNNVHEKLQNKNSVSVFPEVYIRVLGLMEEGSGKFVLHGLKNVGITDKVYVANNHLIELYMNSLEIDRHNDSRLGAIGRVLGHEDVSLNFNANTLLDRHLLVVGSTNSGKSTSALLLLDKLKAHGKKFLIIDPTGEYKNSFRESGSYKKLTLGEDAAIPYSYMHSYQWASIFDANTNTQGAELQQAIEALRLQKKLQKSGETKEEGPYVKHGKKVSDVEDELRELSDDDVDFDLKNLPQQIKENSVRLGNKNDGNQKDNYILDLFKINSNEYLKQKVEYVLANTSLLNFFIDDSQFGSPIVEKYDLMEQLELFQHGKGSLYIDASTMDSSDGIGKIVVNLIAQSLVENSKKSDDACVLFIDEAHRYLVPESNDSDGNSGLISIAREGRKKGIFLFLTTQSPQDIPGIIFGQIGTLVIHRLVHPNDLRVIKNVLNEFDSASIANLSRGEAILTSINLLQNVHLKFLTSNRQHDNGTKLL